MDLLALEAWARRARIAGSTVRKVAVRGGGLFELTLSGPGQPGFLCWTFGPPDPIVALLPERLPATGEAGEVDPGLRRPLEGAVILEVACLYPERRLEITLRPAIPKITPGPLRLVLELRPPGGGLLVDGEGKVRWREGEVPAVTAAVPPPPETTPVSDLAAAIAGSTPAEAARALPRRFFGLPPWLARQALAGLPAGAPVGDADALRVAEAVLSLIAEYRAGRGGFTARPVNAADPDSAWRVTGHPGGDPDVNAAAAAALVAGREASARAAVRRSLLRTLRREVEKTERTIGAISGEIPSPDDVAIWRGRGELLLAYLRMVPASAGSVDLPSFDDPARMVTIPLDPARSGQANASAYFARARKGETARREKVERLALLTERRVLYGALLDSAASETDLEALRGLAGKVVLPGQGRRARGVEEAPRLPVRVFAAGDATVLVGRNAAGNELIYRHLSRGGDLWLHARDWPGSHVLVRGTGKEGTERLAAALAAWFSKGREAGKVEVAATARRNLRKPPGSAPGTVTLRGERSIAVNLGDTEVRTMLRDAGVEGA